MGHVQIELMTKKLRYCAAFLSFNILLKTLNHFLEIYSTI